MWYILITPCFSALFLSDFHLFSFHASCAASLTYTYGSGVLVEAIWEDIWWFCTTAWKKQKNFALLIELGMKLCWQLTLIRATVAYILDWIIYKFGLLWLYFMILWSGSSSFVRIDQFLIYRKESHELYQKFPIFFWLYVSMAFLNSG